MCSSVLYLSVTLLSFIKPNAGVITLTWLTLHEHLDPLQCCALYLGQTTLSSPEIPLQFIHI